MLRSNLVLEAHESGNRIREMLLGEGGSALYSNKELGEDRLLVTGVLDRPLTRLPWPLNLLQPLTIRLVIKKGEKTIAEKHFGRWEVYGAIDAFLDGVSPWERVLIQYRD